MYSAGPRTTENPQPLLNDTIVYCGNDAATARYVLIPKAYVAPPSIVPITGPALVDPIVQIPKDARPVVVRIMVRKDSGMWWANIGVMNVVKAAVTNAHSPYAPVTPSNKAFAAAVIVVHGKPT